MTDYGNSVKARIAMDGLVRTNNQIQQDLNGDIFPTSFDMRCWQGAIANAHTALGTLLRCYREASDDYAAARQTLDDLKRVVRKPTVDDGELKDIVSHLQVYQDDVEGDDGTASDQLSKIAGALGVGEDKDLALEVEQLCENLRHVEESYEASAGVLHEIRGALGVPTGADVVKNARMVAQTKNKLEHECSRAIDGIENFRSGLRKSLRISDNTGALTDAELLRIVSETLDDVHNQHKEHEWLVAQLAHNLGYDQEGRPSTQALLADARKLMRDRSDQFKADVADSLGLPTDSDSPTIFQEIARKHRETSRAEGLRMEIKPILGLPSDTSDAALIEAVKRVKRQQDPEKANVETSTSHYAKFKADVAHKLGLSKHMAVERAILDEIDNLYNQLQRADDFGARIRQALDLPVSLPDMQVAASAAQIKNVKDKTTEALDQKDAELVRQAAEIEKANSGRINGRPVTQALSDLVLTRMRQPYTQESDRNMPIQIWGGILKDEAQNFNFLARRDSDSRTNRLRNAALKIAGICLAFVETLDGVTAEDLK